MGLGVAEFVTGLVVFVERAVSPLFLFGEEEEAEGTGMPEEGATSVEFDGSDVALAITGEKEDEGEVVPSLGTIPLALAWAVAFVLWFRPVAGCGVPAPHTMSACVASSGPSVMVMQPGSLAMVPVVGSLIRGAWRGQT